MGFIVHRYECHSLTRLQTWPRKSSYITVENLDDALRAATNGRPCPELDPMHCTYTIDRKELEKRYKNDTMHVTTMVKLGQPAHCTITLAQYTHCVNDRMETVHYTLAVGS